MLAPLAIGVAYLGGWVFAVFWGIAAIIVMWEWTTLVPAADRRSVLMIGSLLSCWRSRWLRAVSEASDDMRDLRLAAAPIVLVMGMLASAIIAPRGRGTLGCCWHALCRCDGIAPIVLRSDHEFGFVAIIFLFAVVWVTDIAAYFVGRAVGGPKLAPRFSPNKTWSGSIGGLAGAVLAAMLVVKVSGVGSILAAVVDRDCAVDRRPGRRSDRIRDQAPVRR